MPLNALRVDGDSCLHASRGIRLRQRPQHLVSALSQPTHRASAVLPRAFDQDLFDASCGKHQASHTVALRSTTLRRVQWGTAMHPRANTTSLRVPEGMMEAAAGVERGLAEQHAAHAPDADTNRHEAVHAGGQLRPLPLAASGARHVALSASRLEHAKGPSRIGKQGDFRLSKLPAPTPHSNDVLRGQICSDSMPSLCLSIVLTRLGQEGQHVFTHLQVVPQLPARTIRAWLLRQREVPARRGDDNLAPIFSSIHALFESSSPILCTRLAPKLDKECCPACLLDS